jgi:uncharacterized protein (TIGR02452 family)
MDSTESRISVMEPEAKNAAGPEWDADAWRENYAAAKSRGAGFHALRIEVFRHTVEIVRRGCYRTRGAEVMVRPPGESEPVTTFYRKPEALAGRSEGTTTVEVVERDCVDAAVGLVHAGLDVGMLNMANRHVPGGGVLGGAGAQEENLFRRSALFRSLYAYAPVGASFGVTLDAFNRYPLDRATGGIHSRGVRFFRGTDDAGYALWGESVPISVISVPAINQPALVDTPEGPRIVPRLVEPSREKIRIILRVGALQGHNALVLSAFGCGAFRNPPRHMAELFRDVLREAEFTGRFERIVFAIVDDHNAGREHNVDGNVKAFVEAFRPDAQRQQSHSRLPPSSEPCHGPIAREASGNSDSIAPTSSS